MGAESAAQRLQSAWACQQAGQLAEAEAAYRQLLQEFPSHPEVLNRLGVLYTQTGRAPLALAAFRDAAAAAPGNASLQSNLARSALQLGWPEMARAAAAQAIAVGGGSAAWSLLAHALKDLDRVAEAVDACRRGLQSEPSDPALRFNLATCLLLSGQADEATDIYRGLVEQFPQRPRFRHGFGSALCAAGNPGEAERAYRQTLALAPLRADTLVDLAILLLQQKRAAEALALLLDGERQRPLAPAAVAALGVAAWECAAQPQIRRLLDWPGLLSTGPGPQLAPAARGELRAALSAEADLRASPSLKTTRGGQQTGRLGPASAAPVARLVAELEAAVGARLGGLQKQLQALGHPLAAQRPRQWQLQVWATLIDAGGYQAPHLHPGGWASGVYYLDVRDPATQADGAGSIEFGRPPDALSDWHGGPVLRHAPSVGELLLFPSSSYHRTLPHQGTGRRVSLAFDVIAVGPTG